MPPQLQRCFRCASPSNPRARLQARGSSCWRRGLRGVWQGTAGDWRPLLAWIDSENLERLLSGPICLAKARPHRIYDWLVDFSLVWLSERCASVKSRELYVRSLGKPVSHPARSHADMPEIWQSAGMHSALVAPNCKSCLFWNSIHKILDQEETFNLEMASYSTTQ